MSRAHLITRVVGAATAPLVRRAGPAVADAAKHFLQFLGFLSLGAAGLVVAAILYANGIPWGALKTVATLIGLAPIAGAFLVALEQVRLTYRKVDPHVYDVVEPFEQRRPPING
jgi:hypothetical protein